MPIRRSPVSRPGRRTVTVTISAERASVRERVRGRVARGMLTVIVPRARVATLLEDIRTKAAIVNLAYWVEPVEVFGRLVPVAPAAA